jgi:acyl carrier protein
MPDPQQAVLEALGWLMQRKQIEAEITLEAAIIDDLGLDSLDVAELSAILEDNLGKDPYNEGLNPRTVGEIIDWYKA